MEKEGFSQDDIIEFLTQKELDKWLKNQPLSLNAYLKQFEE